MKKEKENIRVFEGLGILLMLIGVSFVNHDWETIDYFSIIDTILIIGGWLVYSFVK